MTNLTIPRTELLDALKFLDQGIVTKSSLPILNCLWIGKADGGLALRTTSLDAHLGIQTAWNWPYDSIAVDFKRLHRFLIACRSEIVELGFTSGKFSCVAGDNSMTMPVLAGDEFPPSPSLTTEFRTVYSGAYADFKSALDVVRHSTSTETTREIFWQVLADAKQKCMIGCSGRSLSKATIQIEFEALIPPSAISILASDFSNENIDVSASESHVSARAGNRSMMAAKLNLGNYPNWQQVIPKEFKHSAILNRESFMDAIKLCALATSDRFSAIKLEFSRNNRLGVSGGDPSIGNSAAYIDAKIDFTQAISFSPKYLIVALSAIKADSVVFSMNDEVSAISISLGGDDSQLHIAMPMRLS